MVLKWFLSISINYCVDLTENVYQDNFAGMWSGNFSKKKPGYLPGFLIQDFSLLAAQRPALNHPLRGWRRTALQSRPSDRY